MQIQVFSFVIMLFAGYGARCSLSNFVYTNDRAIAVMARIPIKFAVKENRTKNSARVFENPRSMIPSSSGSGEAMMSAATNGENHRKSFDVTMWRSRSDPVFPISAIKSFEKRSLTNENK